MPRNPNKIDYSKGLPLGFQASTVIDDPRTTGNTNYHFGEILFLCVTAVLCGMDGFAKISHFGRLQIDWYRKWGTFADGIPTGQTLSNIFALIEPEQFQRCLLDHVKTMHPELQSQIVAIDGKALRGSRNSVGEMVHAVSAWAEETGITLAQTYVDKKSNEITAIPKLLEMLDLKGHIITIDAMGAQTAIAEQIVDQGGDYFIALKGNQGTTPTNVEDHMNFGLTQLDLNKSDCWDYYIAEEDKGHGRITKRSVVVCNNLIGFDTETLKKWPGLQSIIVVEAETQFTTKRKQRKPEKRYYFSSLKVDAKTFHNISIKHWSIENQCHWVLDVTFKEAANRTRTDHAPKNYSTLVRIVHNILKTDDSLKGSLPTKRLEATLNVGYREKLLGLS